MRFDKIHQFNNDDEIVGTLEWREAPGRTFEVHVDVDPAYQRKGIGRSLIQALEEELKRQDKEPMSLYTFMAADNEKAKAFFDAVGFYTYLIVNFYGKGRHAYFGVKVIGEPK